VFSLEVPQSGKKLPDTLTNGSEFRVKEVSCVLLHCLAGRSLLVTGYLIFIKFMGLCLIDFNFGAFINRDFLDIIIIIIIIIIIMHL
jgi:hypothetical protein